MTSDVKVSIILITYNHTSFIREAVLSILNQDFNGNIEVVVADDASTDDTLSIVREYENIDSRFYFVYLPSYENLGVTKNYQRAFKACNGEYIAILEGDDIWVNQKKLSKKITFLEEHTECVFCASNYFLWDQALGRYPTRTPYSKKGFMYYDVAFITKDNLPGNFSAIVYRRSALLKLPEKIFDFKIHDNVLNIILGKYGVFAYLHEPLSAYRIHANGVWNSLTEVEKNSEQIKVIQLSRELTSNLYSQDFDNAMIHLKFKEKFLMAREKYYNKNVSRIIPYTVKKMIRRIFF